MIEISKNYKPKLDALRKEINKRRKEEDRWLSDVYKEIGCPHHGTMSDFIFDYVTNNLNCLRFTKEKNQHESKRKR